jgi:hypothetical protein
VRRFSILVVSWALFTAGLWPVVASAAQSVQIVDARASDPISLQDLTLEGNVISGEVVNHANHTVRNVTLLIRHAFAWKNEFRPGKDDPSRAEYYTVQGEIPAGGSTHFSMHLKEPLPIRKDGTFVTRGEIAGYTEVAVAPPTGSHAGPGALSRCAARGGIESAGAVPQCAALRISLF